MQNNRCYPLRRNFPAWKYLLLAGFPAAPAVFYYGFIYEYNSTGVHIAVFFVSIFLISFGWLALKEIIDRNIPLTWNTDQGFTWMFKKVSWSTVTSVYIQTEITKSPITDAMVEFDRFLVFIPAKGKQVCIPLYTQGLLTGDNDPQWHGFLDTVERRYSLEKESLAGEQQRSRDVRDTENKRFTPAVITYIISAVGILLVIVLFILPADGTTVKAVCAAFFILVMILVSVCKKCGWQNVINQFTMKIGSKRKR